ncbi:hypothetical protein PRUPE_2G167000 [Prunus persica]|uniref:Uncharacterized protein n=1 Tax=Prunus persica TaxID=3760 RepID=A0A251QGU4_PRUPE|nr:hypothetical protein PRUPE_2G167000 [Prunus persica]
MDRRDPMALSGSASYFTSRGLTQSGLHGSQGIHPLSNPNTAFQSNLGGGNIGSALPIEPSSGITPHGVNVGVPSMLPPGEPVKRKRGRPRKYGPDGTVSLALSPSSSANPGMVTSTPKRGRGRPPGSGKKQQLASLGHCNKNNVVFTAGAKSSVYLVSQWCCLYRDTSSALNFWWYSHI